MKKILSAIYLIFLVTVALAIGQEKTIQRVPPKPTVAVDGKSLFTEYCAVCHGVTGKGGGTAAHALQAAPSDLTQISHMRGGKFPEDRILRILKGEEPVAAHRQDMPIWDAVFNNMGSLTMSQMRIHALLQYVEGLQAK